MPRIDDMPPYPGGDVHPVKAEPMEIRSLPDPDAATTAAAHQQVIVLHGGYPDGVWACVECGAELEGSGFAHRNGCAFITRIAAEATARERQRIREILLSKQAADEIGPANGRWLADLLDGDGDD